MCERERDRGRERRDTLSSLHEYRALERERERERERETGIHRQIDRNDKNYIDRYVVWFCFLLWHINHCELSNAKFSFYIYIEYI